MFHILVGNTDPNQGNWLVYPHLNLALIDHSRAFTTRTRLVHELKRIDLELWGRFESLDEAILEKTIGAWVDGAGIRAILKRRGQDGRRDCEACRREGRRGGLCELSLVTS